MPRLCFNEKLRVRQYVNSDPSSNFYTEYYSSIKENSSADWQQQVKNTPTNLRYLDQRSERQQYNTTTNRPLPQIDNYNPYYPDPDFGFDPYWNIHIYNQHHSHFYTNFNKNITDIEPDLPEIDQKLNTHLSKAFVDPWQALRVVSPTTTDTEPTAQLSKYGPVVALTAAVEKRIVNTLIMSIISR